MAAKRMLWSDESMQSAVDSILHDNIGLREAARLYNIPVETLRRHVNGSVEVGARPGPATILTDEEDVLVKYLVEMADMGYGLTRKTVIELAFTIVQKSERKKSLSWWKGWLGMNRGISTAPLSYLY